MASTKIEAFFKARGVNPNCEACGQNTWSLPQDEGTMVVKLATETAPVPSLNHFGFGANAMTGLRPPVVLPQPGSMNAYLVACLNCGNIRLHAEAVVKPAAGL